MSYQLSKKFKWLGNKCPCYNESLGTINATFYRQFCINNEVFEVGNLAVVSKSSKERICRLLCLYELREPCHKGTEKRGLVRWYTWAKKLKPENNPQNIDLDEETEVIEDVRDIDIYVNLEKIKRKCFIIFATESDPKNYISMENLDKSCYFLCRYRIDKKTIEPIMSEANLEKENFDEYTTVELVNHMDEVKTPKKTKPNKRKSVLQPMNVYSSEEEEETKKKSPTNPLKTIKITPGGERKIRSAKKISSVKRNLNESFAEDESKTNNSPGLNYSLVEVDEDNLKLKLRLSKQNKSPSVIMNKIGKDIVDLYLNEADDSPKKKAMNRQLSFCLDQDTPSIRRSSRAVQRKSYADFISPIKNRTYSSDSNYANTPRKSKRERTPDCPKSKQVEISPSKRPRSRVSILKKEGTPRTPRKSVSYADDDLEGISALSIKATPTKQVEDVIARTPKRSAKKNVENTPKLTPGRRAKQIRDGTITPSMQQRQNSVEHQRTPLGKARSQLHVSYIPEALPCREKEFQDIYHFLEGKLLDRCGGCMYISGVPGTGKTATVTEVIKKLQESSKLGEVPKFDYVNINGMRLTEPRQSYVEILKQLSGKTHPWEQAQSILETKFTKINGKKSLPVVLVVDELDILCTKRQDVVYNLLDWPTKASTQLIVLTIANTMDLPERLLMSRVTSRLGLTRLTFQAYTHKQLQEIVTKRLIGTDAFNPDAIQLVARKVASVSGDARRALDICRRAAEIAELEGPHTLVSMTHVNEALNAMITQPKVRAIRRCSRLEQLILQAVVGEVERTGVEETNFLDVHRMFLSIAGIDGFKRVSMTVALAAVSRLGSCRLLLTDSKAHEMDQRIILNVSSDDVYYALRQD